MNRLIETALTPFWHIAAAPWYIQLAAALPFILAFALAFRMQGTGAKHCAIIYYAGASIATWLLAPTYLTAVAIPVALVLGQLIPHGGDHDLGEMPAGKGRRSWLVSWLPDNYLGNHLGMIIIGIVRGLYVAVALLPVITLPAAINLTINYGVYYPLSFLIGWNYFYGAAWLKILPPAMIPIGKFRNDATGLDEQGYLLRPGDHSFGEFIYGLFCGLFIYLAVLSC